MLKCDSLCRLVVVVLAAIVVLATTSASSRSSSEQSMRSEDDLLDTPEWLQDIPQESKMAKYRRRRFVNFPTGSKVQVEFTLTIPIDGIFSDDGDIEVVKTLIFNLPNGTIVPAKQVPTSSYVVGRSFESDDHRLGVYHKAEQMLDNLGYDGHACTLRTICEVAEMPFEHGLMGEVVNLIFSVVTGDHMQALSNSVDQDDYALAQYYGRHHGSCHTLYNKCPISITNLVSNVVPSF